MDHLEHSPSEKVISKVSWRLYDTFLRFHCSRTLLNTVASQLLQQDLYGDVVVTMFDESRYLNLSPEMFKSIFKRRVQCSVETANAEVKQFEAHAAVDTARPRKTWRRGACTRVRTGSSSHSCCSTSGRRTSRPRSRRPRALRLQ